MGGRGVEGECLEGRERGRGRTLRELMGSKKRPDLYQNIVMN